MNTYRAQYLGDDKFETPILIENDFENNELISLYHPGIHGNAISKADKVMPKLLVSEDISNGKLVDLYRLVLFSNHLDKTLRKERIPK